MKDLLERFDALADEIESELSKRRKAIKKRQAELEEVEMFSHYDESLVQAFFSNPYVILPRKTEEWYLIIPKFFDLNVGYLTKSTESYNVFIVNKYAEYLGAVPVEFAKVFKFKPKIPLRVLDGVLLTGDLHQDTAWERYRPYLQQRHGSDQIKIKKGKRFDLIAKLIDDGILPFMRKPVEKAHLVKDPQWLRQIPEIERRRGMDFFKDAFNQFMHTGAIGVFWAMGVGKTIFGLEALSRIRVGDLPNLVVSGSSAALREQWRDKLGLIKLAADTVVETYHSWHKIKDKAWGLVVFDECHHLPANTFSRLSTLKVEYRIGLSATPYREDGRTDYIFALTGFPVGLDWRVLIELGLIREPEITLFLCNTYTDKRRKLGELLQDTLKTLVYCFSLNIGKSLSAEFGIPFVHGSTPVKDRLQIINNSQATIISSAAREGLSFQDIRRTITYNFLFGSRQEETQFFGRLLHGDEEGHHVIMMTDEEYERYGKRLYGIQEKGFRIQIVRIGRGEIPSIPRSKPKARSRPKARSDTSSSTRPVKAQKVVVDDSHRYPFLDERDSFSKAMIVVILRSDYAKEKRGLTIAQIRHILDHYHINYGKWYRVRNAIRALYDGRRIGARREGKKRRYFVTEGS